MTDQRQGTCSQCGEAFIWRPSPKGGRPQTRCFNCKSGGAKARDLRRLAARDPEAADREAQVIGYLPSATGWAKSPINSGIEAAIAPLRLAIGLSMTSDPILAASIAGIDPSDPMLPHKLDDARARFPALAEGRPGELQRVLHTASAMLGATVLARSTSLSGAQAASALKSVGQAVEMANEGAKRVYSTVVLNVAGLTSNDREDATKEEEKSS